MEVAKKLQVVDEQHLKNWMRQEIPYALQKLSYQLLRPKYQKRHLRVQVQLYCISVYYNQQVWLFMPEVFVCLFVFVLCFDTAFCVSEGPVLFLQLVNTLRGSLAGPEGLYRLKSSQQRLQVTPMPSRTKIVKLTK